MIRIDGKGDFKKTQRFLESCQNGSMFSDLDKYGQWGVTALASATPEETGETAHSWYYRVSKKKNSVWIGWYNSNEEDGVVIAILIQYGHGTSSGTYVQGRDFINPALRPVFDRILDDVWEKVKNL